MDVECISVATCFEDLAKKIIQLHYNTKWNCSVVAKYFFQSMTILNIRC